jgi:subtilisin family serine protease
MASAIAAHGRLLGVAPAAHILAVRAFDASIAGAQSTTTRILDGLQWTATSGARIVNMSFTGPADRKMHEMIAAARQSGLVLVAAAGNNGPQAPEAFPAAYPEVIAVTATDVDDKLYSGANHGRYVSVAAPGVDIFVAAPNGGYDFTTGTSVATAHVSGLAALLLERDPGLTPDAVQAILMRTAKDLGPAGRDDEYGAGLVDAYEALLTLAPATAERTLAH